MEDHQQKVSRGKLSAAFGQVVREQKWERHAVLKVWVVTNTWQDESPYKEELELLRVSGDMRLDGTLIQQAIESGRLIGVGEKSSMCGRERSCRSATAR